MREKRRTPLRQDLAAPALDSSEDQRPQLLAYLIVGSVAAALPLLAVNVLQWLRAPNSGSAAHVVADLVSLLLLAALWYLNRAGRTRWAGLGFLLLLSALVPLMFPFSALDRMLIVWAIPVIVASPVLWPNASFLFAAVAAVTYTLLYLHTGGPAPYNVISMALLFPLALLAWFVTARQQRHLAERKRAEQTQSALFRISQVAGTASDLPGLLASVHRELAALLTADNFYVALYDASTESYSFPYAADKHEAQAEFTSQQLGRSLTDYVRRTATSLLADAAVHNRLMQQGEVDLVGHPSPAWMGAPLKTAHGVIGVVVVQDYEDPLRYSRHELGLLTFVADHIASVIERKRAEDAQRESEERYRCLFEHSPISLWEEDFSAVKRHLDGLRAAGMTDLRAHFSEHPEEVARCAAMVRIVDVNQATLRLYAAVGKEKLLAGLDKVFTTDSYGVFAEELVSLAAGRSVFVGESMTRTLMGEEKRVMLTWLLVPGYQDTLSKVLVSITDISDLRRAEQERLEMERRLLHSQKLESLGVLAGGIAHDFNNLLLAVLGNMELALEDLSPVSSARPRVEQAVVAAKRAADLTRQMLAYSGRGHFDIRAVDLSELVEENAHMLRTAVSRNVTFSMQLSKDLPPVEADAGQIQQVVMNLIVNASEAIGDTPGVVTLATGVQECDAAYLSRSLVEVKPAPGRFVWLEVSDTGCGMDQRTLQHMFEPFFSTKFAGRGLGMSAVHGIVLSHRGAIVIDSRVGKGARVRVLFPAAEHLTAQPRTLPRDAPQPRLPCLVDKTRDNGETRTTRPAETAAADAEPAHQAKAAPPAGIVLVVDDEPMVCDLAAATLTGVGLQVLTAADGMQAVELFRQHADEIVCVLLDLTMPKMDGVTTLELLCQIRPDVRVILSSGYDEQEATRRFAGQGLAGFLQKPYQLQELRAELQRVLEAAA